MQIKKSLLYGRNPITNYLPKIDEKDVFPIMYLISNLSNRFFEHRYDSNCLALSQNTRYNLFGQNRWRQKIFNRKEHVFNRLFTQPVVGNSIDSITNGYEPTKLLIDAYYKWHNDNKNTYELINVDDSVIEVKGIELTSLIEERSDFYEDIEINIEPIKEKLIEYWNPIQDYINNNCTINDKELYDFVRYKVVPLKELFYQISNNDNKLRIHYTQHYSGRYYGVGSTPITSIKKEIRDVILNDYHENDINVSAPLLLSQIYKNIKNEKVPKTISDFIKNKKRMREIFAEKYNIPLEKSKSFFTSLFFGSTLIKNDYKKKRMTKKGMRYYKSETTENIGTEIVNRILSDKSSFEYKLYLDVRKLFKVIGSHYKKIDTKKVVGFNNHTKMIEDTWKNEEVVSHVYQSLESLILDTMIRFYIQTTQDKNYVRLHDCLYTKIKINKIDLYSFIKKETTYDVLFRDPISKQYSDKELYKLFNMKYEI